MKRRSKLQRIFLRCKIAYRLAFKEKHGLCVFVDEQQLTTLIADNTIYTDIKVCYFGMMEHQMGQVIKVASEGISDVDIICSKAEFDIRVQQELKIKEE